MRISQYFLPLLKETPAEAQIASHRLMLRAGMIKMHAAGIYSWLPLGLRVLKKVENIIADELNKAGCVQLLMPTLQPTDLWKESGRYEAYGKEMLRFPDRADRELLYSPTNEEMINDIVRSFVKSYKSLPINLYQINWKFRDEIRPRFGVMRGREFFMKDAYSFHLDVEDAKREYNKIYGTYHKIFNRLGLVAIAVKADPGPIGGDMSQEFQVLAETGESQVYYDAEIDKMRDGKIEFDAEKLRSLYAAADEMHVPENCPVKPENLRTARGIEVGHIFYVGKKYSDIMKIAVSNKEGVNTPLEMCTYGIGVSRLVGAIIEANHDENGIVWTDAVAPFKVAIINIRVGEENCDRISEEIYGKLTQAGIEVIYDDTSESAGKKFSGMDLIGIPYQIIVGPKGVANGTVELKNRRTGEKIELSTQEAIQRMI
ncbi:MAG: proline--tRNA ligase [Pseudomonadota bacterium]